VDAVIIEKLIDTLKKETKKVLSVSIHDYQSLEKLKKVLLTF
jgi:hypothetical protein